VEPELDQGMINTLLQNGVPEMAAKHAVHNAGGGGAEVALEWFFSRIGDPTLEAPLLIPNPKKGQAAAGGSAGGFVPDPESLMMLTSMGFSDK